MKCAAFAYVKASERANMPSCPSTSTPIYKSFTAACSLERCGTGRLGVRVLLPQQSFVVDAINFQLSAPIAAESLPNFASNLASIEHRQLMMSRHCASDFILLRHYSTLHCSIDRNI